MASTKSASTSRKNGSTRSASAKRSQAARRGQAARRRSNSGNGASAGPVDAVRHTVSSGAQTVANGAQSTGHAIGEAASKAKGPALTGGAALAGLVGGMAIAARGSRRKVLGVPIPGTRRPLVQIKAPRRKGVGKDVVKAGGEMAKLAGEVRMAREQLDTRRRRSPIEVVLEGLTSRRGRAG
jgi:hypothetical protein